MGGKRGGQKPEEMLYASEVTEAPGHPFYQRHPALGSQPFNDLSQLWAPRVVMILISALSAGPVSFAENSSTPATSAPHAAANTQCLGRRLPWANWGLVKHRQFTCLAARRHPSWRSLTICELQ
jgi:hypothetical protein